ncbi:LON peptidase substrate-binding domain-containing protein [Pontibacterium granulatum]|uniref:LON peptidase substrate-binding domain-containing protein n=1 Tax=Pontibacterium granulatum TaxID=2036029 RepID=UPI00249BD98A|nr:LON peptidase substrate-binding domain-containing protein [Pontibacterium granulatum]MDI3323478.1 LON peptidase substrate-binding domain-containing protein [Pontibacterium granulatum]
MVELPLFPLPVVLYPMTVMPLQIFEPRYLRMVKESLQNQTGFVIVQSLPEEKVQNGDRSFYRVGCYAKVIDWHPQANDMLGIEVEGQFRVRIHDYRAEPDSLLVGQCEPIEEPSGVLVAEKYQLLVKLAMELEEHPMVETFDTDIDYRDAAQVGYLLAELLPFTHAEKQLLLESDDPLLRLEAIQSLLQQLGAR